MKATKIESHRLPAARVIAIIGLVSLCAVHPATAQPSDQFTACEQIPGMTPVQVLLFSGSQPDADLTEFEMPDTDDGVSAEPTKKGLPQVSWNLAARPKPWNFVCGYVDSASKAAGDQRQLGIDDANSIKRHVTEPIPDAATSCSINFTPGPDKGFPNVKDATCILKPGANQTPKPNRS